MGNLVISFHYYEFNWSL